MGVSKAKSFQITAIETELVFYLVVEVYCHRFGLLFLSAAVAAHYEPASCTHYCRAIDLSILPAMLRAIVLTSPYMRNLSFMEDLVGFTFQHALF